MHSYSSQQYLDLVPLNIERGRAVGFDKENTVRLEGAHGEEIVRSLCFGDDISGRVFTAGEDGCVKAWRMEPEVGRAESSTRGLKKKVNTSKREARNDEDLKVSTHGKSARFKPY